MGQSTEMSPLVSMLSRTVLNPLLPLTTLLMEESSWAKRESQSMPVQTLQAPSNYCSRLSKKENAQGVLEIWGWNSYLWSTAARKVHGWVPRFFSCLVSELIYPYSTHRAIFSWLKAKSYSSTGYLPCHPNEEDLISDDGNITALYLPPNVTSLVQPMDQRVLVALTRRYKNKLLRRLLIEDKMAYLSSTSWSQWIWKLSRS